MVAGDAMLHDGHNRASLAEGHINRPQLPGTSIIHELLVIPACDS
jgi:hypothetical protein